MALKALTYCLDIAAKEVELRINGTYSINKPFWAAQETDEIKKNQKSV